MSVVEENWVYQINIDDIEKNLFDNFEKELNILCENIPKVLEDNFLIENINHQVNLAQTYDDELKFLTEGNKELKQQIESKLKELSDRQTKYENYKQGKEYFHSSTFSNHSIRLVH